MNNLSFKSRVFQLTMVPILVAIVLIASSLTVFFWQQQDQLLEDMGRTRSVQIARFFKPLLNRPLSDVFKKNIQNGLSGSLEETSFRAASVYDADGKLFAHAGPEFIFPLSKTLPHIQALPEKMISKSSSLFTHTITAPTGTEILGWVQVEVSHHAFLAKKYQMAFLTLAISVISLLIGIAIILLNSGRVYKPLNKIREGLAKLSVGNLDVDIRLPKGWAFKDLAESINRTASALRRAQEELKHNMEQANEDLRETLDTVEIQNVELNLARKEALEASRAKSEFLANTSHEIRTPINGIIGFTGLLSKTKMSPQQQEYLQTIQKSSQGLLTTINDILDFSKMETGQLVLDYNPFNLRYIVEDTLQVLGSLAQAKNIQLIALIEASTPLSLLGDPLRLKQIFNSLISNAIKFSEKGNIVINIKSIKNDGDHVQLKFSVTDQGAGISPEHQKTLFNAFTQADTSSTRSKGGVGLGLAIAKGLIQKMQGNIFVESKMGEGSTFWFTARFGIDLNSIDLREYKKLAGKRVLIFDDNAMAVEQLKTYLTYWKVDYCVVSSENAIQQAIEEEASTRAFHAIIWDISAHDSARRWVQKNAVYNKLSQHEYKFMFLSKPGCNLDYDSQAQDEKNTVFIHKPLNHDIIYTALTELIISPDELEHATHHGDRIKAKILAVDDNPANLQLIGELLKDIGAEVILAEDGEKALKHFSTIKFDLIFMDIQMPGIDGLETTRRIRKLENNLSRTPVVALTAHSMTDQKADLLLAGLDDYLSKPVSEGQLIHVIQRWTSSYNKKEQITQTSQPAPIAVSGQMMAIIESPVNIEKCLELSNNKPRLAKDMLSMLLAGLPKDQQKITEHYKQQNFDLLEAVVHKLNGGASYCGVPDLKNSCAKLDELLRKQQHENIHHHVTNVLEAIAQLLNWDDEYDLDVIFDIEDTLT